MSAFRVFVWLLWLLVAEGRQNDKDGSARNQGHHVESGAKLVDHEEASTWSSWASWTGCTATCGRGVRLRQRICLHNRRSSDTVQFNSCNGVRKQYEPCKGEPCPPGTLDFRSTQCTQLATTLPFPENLYQWRAMYNVSLSKEPCSLFCQTEDRHPPLIRHLSTTVIDGTPCAGRIHDLCIESQCLTLGCDGNFNSNLVNDKCGICGGDNTTCRYMKGHYIKTEQNGLHSVLSLPRGSTNVKFTMNSTKNSYLVLQSHGSGLIFSGISRQFSPLGEEHRIGKETFYYRRDGENETATITSTERTSDTVNIKVFVKEANDTIKIDYEYYIPIKDDNAETKPYSSEKRLHPFLLAAEKEKGQSSNASEAKKESSRIPDVIQLYEDVTWEEPGHGEALTIDFEYDSEEGTVDLTDRQTEVAPVLLNFTPTTATGTTKEPVTWGRFNTPGSGKNISEDKYTYLWKTFGVSHCSATCTPGVMYPYAQCYRSDGQMMNESFCDSIQRPEPKLELCLGRLCNARWVTGMWSQCSVSCGEGRQKRSVRCWRVLAPGFDSTVRDYMCAEHSRPPDQRKCKHKPCGPSWQTSPWSECSVPCGSGVQRRQIRCSSTTEPCSEARKPPDTQSCYNKPCFNVWITGRWSECSGPCGEGIRRRSVVCRSPSSNDEDDLLCQGIKKPLTRTPCTTGDEEECPPAWIPQEWDKCSKLCGEGNMTREVLCVGLKNSRIRIFKDRRCRHLPKPELWTPCQNQPCQSQWFASTWSQCSVTCGIGQRLREVQCYQVNVSALGCDPDQQPSAQEPCEMEPCPDVDKTDSTSICMDYPNAKCDVVYRIGMCDHWYYKKACCKTCSSPDISA